MRVGGGGGAMERYSSLLWPMASPAIDSNYTTVMKARPGVVGFQTDYMFDRLCM